MIAEAPLVRDNRSFQERFRSVYGNRTEVPLEDDEIGVVWVHVDMVGAEQLPLIKLTAKNTVAITQPFRKENLTTWLTARGILIRQRIHGWLLDVRWAVVELQEAWDRDVARHGVGDHAIGVIADLFAVECRVDNPAPAVRALHELAWTNKYCEAEEWLEAQPKWDGKRDVIGELSAAQTLSEDEDPVLFRRCLEMWLIQAVQAVCGWRDPQAVGYVLVLAGAQGVGKSRFVEGLAPAGYVQLGVAFHAGASVNSNRDVMMSASRTPFCELGELEVTFKKSEIAGVKSTLTQPFDIYRPPYGRAVEVHPRATVFMATVNSLEFLVDRTGNRRFWPFKVDRMVRADEVVDLGELWAQARELWARGDAWWPEEEDGTSAALTERAIEFEAASPVSSAIAAKLHGCKPVARAAVRGMFNRGDYILMNVSMIANALGVVVTHAALAELRELLIRAGWHYASNWKWKDKAGEPQSRSRVFLMPAPMHWQGHGAPPRLRSGLSEVVSDDDTNDDTED